MPPKISARLQTDALTFRTEYRALAPANATPEGIERAMCLCGLKVQLKRNKSDPDAKDPSLDTLTRVDKGSPLHELYQQRRVPTQANSPLRNKAFLISLILQGEGHVTSIPPAWQVPHDTLPQAGSKRSSPEAPGTPEVGDGFNLKDKKR